MEDGVEIWKAGDPHAIRLRDGRVQAPKKESGQIDPREVGAERAKP